MKNPLEGLKFSTPSGGKAPLYNQITSQTSYRESISYYLDTTKGNDSLMKGKGVAEMQAKIAYVFAVFYPSLFKKFFKNPKFVDSVTGGIYGPKTMNLVMEFQQKYMKSHFEEVKWDPLRGYGSFGGNTKKVLERFYRAAKYDVKHQGKKGDFVSARDIEDAYKSMGSGY